MTIWIRFEKAGETGFGILDGDTVLVHTGDMFDNPTATGQFEALDGVKILMPATPQKMLGLWNNFHQLAEKFGNPAPEHPLYFFKGVNSYLGPNETIRRPASYDGPVVYEGELGIVIGKRCTGVSEDEAADAIFGYTCINDITAAKIIDSDKTFAQWTRAKSFDTFGVFGPAIATGLDYRDLSVKTVLNGQERQNYPLADMIIPPQRQVSLISHDMTLEAGDIICCGTSLGVGSMKEPSNEVSITIDGIGTLNNTYVNE